MTGDTKRSSSSTGVTTEKVLRLPPNVVPSHCTRTGCQRAIHRRMGKAWYCVLHCRVVDARGTARYHDKTVPSFETLEALFLAIRKCPGCGQGLDPFKKVGRRDPRVGIPTLQHRPDGSWTVICHSCNVREGHSEIREQILSLSPDQKYCPSCKRVLALDSFYRVKGHVTAICKACRCRDGSRRYALRKVPVD